MRSVLLAVVLVLGLAWTPASGAFAQSQPWSQEKVTALADELVKSVSGLRDAIRKSPMWENPQQKRTLSRIADYLRRIEAESHSLKAQLAKGAGMDETWPNYRNIQLLRRNASVLAKRTDVSAITKPKLDRAEEVLTQIAQYYPPETTPKPKS